MYMNIYIYIYIIFFITAFVAQLAKASDTQAVGQDSTGPLINFIKCVLKYHLEVIFYNCV